MGVSLIKFFQTAGWQKTVAVAFVTLITLTIVAVAAVTMTSAGCGVANSFGLTHVGGRCLPQSPVAGLSQPTPKRFSPPPTTSQPAPPQPPSPQPEPPSSYPPPNSSGVPPNNPPVSSVPPGLSGTSPYPYNGNASMPGQYPPGLNCSLPIFAQGPGSGGFVTFPGGTYIADPKSSVTTPTPPGASPTPPGYGGPGPGGLTYDRQYSRWLPVPYRWASPDGSHYAFQSGGGIYVVTVSTGALTEVGEGKSWSLLDVKNEGVYADVVNQAGLWLLPFSGSPRELTTSGYWQAVGGGAAYGTLSSAVPSGAQYVIVRLDLSNGSQTDWFNRGSEVATIIGFDAAGNALVASQQQYGASYWLSTGALTGDLIYAPTWYGSRLNIYGPVVADGHGVWLTGYWSNGPLIILMTNGQLNGVSTLGANIAGACA